MQHNRNHGRRALRLFEFGHVFARTDAADVLIDGFAEHEALAVALTGPVAPAHWDAPARAADVFDLKGVAELLLDDLGVTGVTMTPAEGDAVAAHGLTMTAGEADAPLGALVRVAPDVAADFDLDAAPVFVAEFDVDALRRHARPRVDRVYEAVARFPAVERDLAVVVSADQPAGPLLAAVREAGAPLLEDATVFDLYAGAGVPAGQQSVAFALRFGAPDRTLTDEEVDTRVRAIVETLHARFDATLRG
jgi:phenylalanyl-tRNA synthetase beta chain